MCVCVGGWEGTCGETYGVFGKGPNIVYSYDCGEADVKLTIRVVENSVPPIAGAPHNEEGSPTAEGTVSPCPLRV